MRALGWVLVGMMTWACTGAPSSTEPKADPKAGDAKAAGMKDPRGKGKAEAKGEGSDLTPVAKADRPAAPAGPNVLLLVLDTVRADHLSLYGYGRPTTPRLEALAADAVVYDRAVSPGMWTLPSHASLFTGLPESAHGANASHHWLDKRFPTLAGTLFDAGYSTFLFGANPYLQDHTGLGRGFEVREFPVDAKWKKKAKDTTMAKVHPDDASNTLGPKYKPGMHPSGRGADRTKDAGPVATEALLTWIKERPEQDRPFFATINYMEAHVPRIPTMASRKALFDDAAIAEQLAFDQSFGELLAYTVALREFTDHEQDLIADVYDACLRDLDAIVGDLLDQLAAAGVLDDTVVIITADHGEHLGDHHRADHKFSVYNALVRVPLIVRYPKAMPARREGAVTSVLDVFATVAELTGAPMPEGTLSRSLVAPREGEAVAYSELVSPTRQVFERMKKVHPDFDPSPWERTYASVETPSLKCIARSDGHRELYDVTADPAEERDLAGARPADVEALCGRIDGWRGTFATYDPKAAGNDEGPGAMDAETRRRLVELGYLSEEEAGATPAPTPRKKGGGR